MRDVWHNMSTMGIEDGESNQPKEATTSALVVEDDMKSLATVAGMLGNIPDGMESVVQTAFQDCVGDNGTISNEQFMHTLDKLIEEGCLIVNED